MASRNGAKPADVVREAASQLVQLTGTRPEKVLGLNKDGDGWRVTFEVLELSRVPNSTDLLGAYEVTVDKDGDLIGYERRHRYLRGQPDGGGE